MSLKLKLPQKQIAFFLAIMLLFSTIAASIPVFAVDITPETVAEWSYSSTPSATPVVATAGVNKSSAFLTNKQNATITASATNGMYANTWLKSNPNYWQLALSTEGYKELSLTAKVGGSNTAPKDFKIVYSTDNGVTEKDVPDSAYACTTGVSPSGIAPIVFTKSGASTISLPTDAANCKNLLIRFIMTSTNPIGSTSKLADPGNSRINDIVISGVSTGDVGTSSVGDSSIGSSSVGASSVGASSINISSARLKNDGTEATVTGVVSKTIPNTVYIQDSTGGIAVYSKTVDLSSYTAGETIKIRGIITLFRGLVEIVPASSADITVESADIKTLTPKEITVAQLLTGAYQCQLVKIKGATLTAVATNSNHTISQSGSTVTMRCTGSTTLTNFVANDIIDVVGVASMYDTAQLIVKSETDISKSVIVTPPTQPQVAAVTAIPANGTATVGTKVALSCTTTGATIKYSLDDGKTYNNYSSEITIEKLPTTIMAYAVKDTYKDSEVATFTYKEQFTGTYNLYFGQLHSHTNFSDGDGTVRDAFKHAKEDAKVDYLAVTDHSNSFDNASASTVSIENGSASTEWVDGHKAADEYTKDGSFVGIYGYEMTWTGGLGHMNTFNTDGFESRENATFKAANGLQNYYNALKKVAKSISQFNHPGTTFGDFNDFSNYDEAIDRQISLIEVGNGEGPVRGSGYFASYEYYTRALDKGWHVAPTNNQDNHKGNWGDSNTARTVVLAESLTRDNIYNSMKDMHVYATEDNNLRVEYTLNGEVQGNSIAEKPSKVNIAVKLEDQDNEALGKVSVIVNGGKVAASKTLTSSKETVNFELPCNYTYYYIRIDQADKDIAVTAPVWIGATEKLGISKTISSSTMPVKGQKITISSQLYNNEAAAFNVSSLTYSVEGKVINTAVGISSIASLSTASHSFAYTFDKSGSYTINAELKGTLNGVERVFNDVLKLKIYDPNMVSKVVVDGTHANDYVTGYYANNINNFTTLANAEQVTVNVEKNKLTDDVLKDAQILIISAPCKKADSKYPSQIPSTFSDEDFAVIKRYVDNGGNLIVSGLADYQDGTGDYQSSTQLNKLLAAINATSRINNDEVIDKTTNGGQTYRLAFNTYDMTSPYLNGVDPTQTYSFYSGCSISLDDASLASGKTKWLVKGHSTTESFDSNANLKGVALPKGSVYALAVEQLSGGGKMFIGGTVFVSDYEVKATLDNNSQLQNSNYNIVMNILNSVKKDIPTTPISTIRKAAIGEAFVAEGIVTAGNKQGSAFYDTIYIQDETGGLDIYPVTTELDIKVGQKVKVIGSVDTFEGDLELRITDVEVTDTDIKPVAPKKLTTKEAMDSSNSGLLVKVTGTITKVVSSSGVVSEIFVKDSSGTEARLFINSYIGYSNTISAKLETLKAGDTISAIGLASVDTVGARLRVRDRSEIDKKTIIDVILGDSDDSSDTPTPVSEIANEVNQLPTDVTAISQDEIKKLEEKINNLNPIEKAQLIAEIAKIEKASKALDEKLLTDTKTGIKITGDNLPKHTTIVVASITDNQALEAAQHSAKNVEILALYDISLSLNNAEYEPNAKVLVSLPVDASLTNKQLAVLHFKDDGTIEAIAVFVQNGKATFETDSFSKFAVVEKEDAIKAGYKVSGKTRINPKTGANEPDFAGVVILSICAISFVLLSRLKKRNSVR